VQSNFKLKLVLTSGISESEGGLDLPTFGMKSAYTYTQAGWDFTNVWNMKDGQTYPYFRWQEAEECGDMAHPYPVGDLDFDCVVNLLDWAIFCRHWLEDARIK